MGSLFAKLKSRRRQNTAEPRNKLERNNPRNCESTLSLPNNLNVVSSLPEPTTSSFGTRDRRASESEVTPVEPKRYVKELPKIPVKPKSPEQEVNRSIARALFDYERCYDDDLGFVKGQEMEILSQDDNANGWWYMRRMSTGEVGYVPSNYFLIKGTSFESQEWWFGSDRKEATKQLLLPGNPVGTFMVRKSREEGAYALSMQSINEKGEPHIRHYKILTTEDGQCYIGKNTMFKDLIELVKYYSENPGLVCRLTQPCPKELQKIPFKEFQVKRSEIQLREQLGSGNFGTVYAGIFRNVVEVAVKTLKAGSAVNPDDFLKEAETMHNLRHPRLVQLMGVCVDVDDKSAYIITEKMHNRDLLQHLRTDKGELIKYPDLIEMAVQVADGMSYLEEQKVIHRDLRAANVLVGEKNSVKISDFGLARLLDSYYDEDDYYKNKKDEKFPFRWTAPEVILRHMSNSKSDVWSFGVLLSELVTYGRLPYKGMNNRTVLDEITKGYRIPNPVQDGFTCSDELYAIMMNCWDEKPELRPSFLELRYSLEDLLEDSSNYVE